MARPSDPTLGVQWTQRLERHAASSGQVTSFCQAEGVSEASFSPWRRKLSRDAAASRGASQRVAASKLRAAAFQPVQLVVATSSDVTVRLGDAVPVALGSDADTIARAVAPPNIRSSRRRAARMAATSSVGSPFLT